MRVIYVDGRPHEVPRYISRVPGAWTVRLPGESSKSFADASFCIGNPPGGSPESCSLSAAKAYRFERLPLSAEDMGGYYKHTEREGKETPTGIPSVFLVHKPSGTVLLYVRIKGMPVVTVNVGNQANWEANLPDALEDARRCREQQIFLKEGGAA